MQTGTLKLTPRSDGRVVDVISRDGEFSYYVTLDELPAYVRRHVNQRGVTYVAYEYDDEFNSGLSYTDIDEDVKW